MAKANADLGGLGVVAELGDARKLTAASDSYDVVLVFGPLYHLTEREDCLAALRGSPGSTCWRRRSCRWRNTLRFALRRPFAVGFSSTPSSAIVVQDLEDGQHRNPDERPHWWTTAFLHHPDQLRNEVVEAGLVVRELVGLEGLAFWLPNIAARLEDPDEREVVLWSARATESEPALAALSAHLLVVASRPA